ncbi:MAG TPA: hypothetical protein VEX88_12415 [Glaciibacter sp.]|nr:hypothetical protein [Glaciibacter sp.]
MTTLQLMRMLARRWYVVVAIVLLAGAGYVSLSRESTVYTAQTDIVFIASGTDPVGGFDEQYRDSLVHFAAAIEREYHAGRTPIRLAADAPLFGAGVERGEQVLLPNTGSQWLVSFDSPRLSVDVVGPDPQWVRARLTRVLERIETLARQRQEQSGVAEAFFIRTERAPQESVVKYVGSSRSASARALLSLLAVSIGLAAAATVAVDRLTMRRGTSLQRKNSPDEEERVP